VNDRLGELGIAQLDPSGPMNNIYIIYDNFNIYIYMHVMYVCMCIYIYILSQYVPIYGSPRVFATENGPTTHPLASPGDADSLGSGDPHW